MERDVCLYVSVQRAAPPERRNGEIPEESEITVDGNDQLTEGSLFPSPSNIYSNIPFSTLRLVSGIVFLSTNLGYFGIDEFDEGRKNDWFKKLWTKVFPVIT